MPERYFPEIIDERSSYLNLSPLTSIIRDLRRKNVVTTAAASGPQMSLLDSSDPWGSSEALGEDHQTTRAFCSCLSNISNLRRRSGVMGRSASFGSPMFGYSSSPMKSIPDSDAGSEPLGGPTGSDAIICPECGMIKNTDYERMDGRSSMRSPRQIMRLSSWMDSTRAERLDSPQHAKALLQATPHLRIISPASTDMGGGQPPNNFLSLILPSSSNKQHHHQSMKSSASSHEGNGSSPNHGTASDYRASLVRDMANQQAAAELSSLLWILAHEMSLEDYGTVESEVFTSVFALVHSQENERRMAGLAALDALIDAPSADEEKKAIKFANTLSNGLRSAHGDYEFLSAVSKALGHMAMRTANVDFVESEVPRALEWLRTERSDRR